MPPPTSPTQAVSALAVSETGAGGVLAEPVTPPDEWEEPHPGRPLSPSTLAAAGHAGENSSDRDSRGGMAAKYEGFARNTPARPWVARQYSRPKMRLSVLRRQQQLAPPAGGSKARQTSSIGSRHSLESNTTSGPRAATAAATVGSAGTAREMDIDVDATSAPGSAGDGPSMLQGPVESPISSLFRITDFANHPGFEAEPEQRNDGSAVPLDSGAFTRASHEEDPYGWEAELERKGSIALSIPEARDCACDQFQCRGTNGGKRSLLHRVLNMGSSGSGDLSRSHPEIRYLTLGTSDSNLPTHT